MLAVDSRPDSAPQEPKDHSPEVGIVNVPNALSLARLGFGIVAMALIVSGEFLGALIFFVIGAITDILDGVAARVLNQATAFGRQLDPMIDKLLVAGILIFLIPVPGSGVTPWFTTLIVCRELIIQWLRSLLEGKGIPFGAKRVGKFKTVAQCLAITSVLFVLALNSEPPGWLILIRHLLLGLALILTLYSALTYVLVAIPRRRSPASPELTHSAKNSKEQGNVYVKTKAKT